MVITENKYRYEIRDTRSSGISYGPGTGNTEAHGSFTRMGTDVLVSSL